MKTEKCDNCGKEIEYLKTIPPLCEDCLNNKLVEYLINKITQLEY